MNILNSLIGTLSFAETNNRFAAFFRRGYFAVAYNTTFPVNLMLALGSMSPYLVILMLQGETRLRAYIAPVVITLISAYFYNIIYIVNDIIDRRKDSLLKIPKQTARHVLGNGYLYYLAASYLVLMIGISLIWHRLFLSLLGYSVLLAVLSAMHSHAGRGKVITVFIERFAKFCSPFAFMLLALHKPELQMMLVGSLCAYPLGFTFDYAYKGYLRDRLGRRGHARYWLYAAYWTLVALVVGIIFSRLTINGWLFGGYLLIYFSTIALTNLLTYILPLGFLDNRYLARVVHEKRRLLTYGLIQLGLIIAALMYAIIT